MYKGSLIVLCERSAIIRDAFLSSGWDAYSCDLVPRPGDKRHIVADAIEVGRSRRWNRVIANPPCTFLAKAQLWQCNKSPSRMLSQDQAVKFVKDIWALDTDQLAIENPAGCLQRRFMPYSQMVQPYMFGSEYKKEICLWLRGLPLLYPTVMSPSRKSLRNHTNGRMSQEQKSVIMSRFFPEVANAMASQWL